MARNSRLVMNPSASHSLSPRRAFVAERGFRLDLGRQRFRLSAVARVAAGKAERQRIANNDRTVRLFVMERPPGVTRRPTYSTVTTKLLALIVHESL